VTRAEQSRMRAGINALNDALHDLSFVDASKLHPTRGALMREARDRTRDALTLASYILNAEPSAGAPT
jgi:hypothetical protein